MAGKERIERAFQVSFKHPNLHSRELVINGLNEANLPIITSREPDKVCLSIWGILPEGYTDEWEHFQNLTNTLTIDERDAHPELWYTEALEKRRCLILVTGFFTTYLKDGTAYPYYVSYKSGEPFYLAGIYNVLEDGFITCALVVGKADNYIKRFQNIVDTMPILIPTNQSDFWLDDAVPLPEVKNFLALPRKNDLHATPIIKEFFNQNISYDSMLEPYEYHNLPFDK